MASRRRRGGVHWGSFGGGLVVGVALTLTGALLPELLTDTPAARGKSRTPPPATSAAPRFEFFDTLPNSRESVDTRPYERLTPNSTRDDLVYLLQAGSFSSREDAERLRASVLLTGLEATVSEATLASGAQRYRVIAGPFLKEPEMRRAMTKLREQNINPLLLARKPGAG
jgi:cell division protein FtsN